MISPISTYNPASDMTQEAYSHQPVMLNEVMEHLNMQPGHIVVDATLGLGGHSSKISENIGKDGLLIAVDRDAAAIEIAQKKLSDSQCRIDFVHKDYRYIDQVLDEVGVDQVDGILLDLGVSSYQIDNPERGFSFRSDGPLDMRMDQNSQICAYDLINSLSENELTMILKQFGQERWASRIAQQVVSQRMKTPIETTYQLSEIVLKAYPRGQKHQRIHPATRTFQAFRIAVNRELESLEIFMDHCMSYLRPGGRLCIISFHSLEDKIVKNKFKEFARQNSLSILTKKPLQPTEKETQTNPRARSAKLRVAERV